jgi:aminoglycoside phosphotransferase (APT) family kinase protein
MPAEDMPAAEVDVGPAVVRALLAEQFPDLADFELTELAYGWDNAIFRLGDDLTVRVPRRAMAAELVEHEQRWLPTLAPRLPLPIPAPLRAGRPGGGYPWSWSVCPWLPGVVATRAAPDDPLETAATIGAFLSALHRPAPDDAPANPYRGGPLAERDDVVRQRAAQLSDLIDAPSVVACWSELATTRPWTGPRLWLHGDLHPANLLVDDGRLSAVIDFGDITAGDPATDLAVAWMLLPAGVRTAFRAAAGDIDDDTWTRARGWALSLALAYMANSADNPVFAHLGEQVLTAALVG